MRTTGKPKIVMHPVKSSNIVSIGYRKANKAMYVKYMKGDLYLFKNVSQEQYQEIMFAESVGKALYQANLIGVKLKGEDEK